VPFAATPLASATVMAAVRAWARPLDGTPVHLYGGEDSTAYRLGDVVLRIGPAQRDPAEVEWCHGIAARAAAAVPEVPVPLRTPAGTTVVVIGGRPVSLWPHVEGGWLDRDDPGQRRQAARLLARVHRALASAPGPPPRPYPSLMDPGLDRPFPGVDHALTDPALDAWLARRSNAARHPLHGDWYRGNLLVHGGRISAVLDWDEAWIGPPEFELAAAAREFGSRWDTDLTAARRFVDDYLHAGGTAPSLPDEALAQLIRHRLRCEVVASGRSGRVIEPDDADYRRHQVDLFTRLRPG
jgi:Ser/Thr protein kinase RdoA (MazF antagonist)